MKKLFEFGNRYAAASDWTDFALTKICLCSMGVIIGTCVAKEKKADAQLIACAAFGATYVPLMWKVCTLAMEMIRESDNSLAES